MKWFKKNDKQIEIGNWYVGWHTWNPEITYKECGYEDGRGNLTISLFGWLSRFYFPWVSKRFPGGDCDAPEWGIAIHSKTLWIYRGGNGNLDGGTKTWTWDLPFINYGTSIRWDIYTGPKSLEPKCWLPVDWTKYDYRKGDSLDKATKWNYIWVDKYDGKEIPCTYYVEEMEWRPKWLKWTSLFSKVKRSIAITFSEEVGSRKGSWKGGVIGFGFEMLPRETPQQCIERAHKEKKF